MGTPETKTSTPERKEVTHVTPIIDKARGIVGDFKAQVHDDEKWDEDTADQRTKAFAEKLKRGEPVSLMELYDSNSDADRRQTARYFSKTDKEKRELTPVERNEVVAGQLRVTSRETLAKSLDVYFQLLDLYKGMKERGVTGESKDEADVFSHLRLIQIAAASRVNVAVQIKDHPNERETLLKEALKHDRELVRLLMCQDPDIPGNNKDGLLPVHRLMLAMLKKEYEGMVSKYRTIADEGYQRAKERADKAQKAMETAFPGQTDFSKTPLEVVEPVLRSVGYKSVQDYRRDVEAVKSKAAIFDKLKDEGKKNVDTLADLTASLGRFQARRSELSTVRHHFDQGYALDADAGPLPGKTPEETMNQMRGMFEAEQNAAIGSLDRHLEKVEEGVLNVGLPEKAETLWNEQGRLFVSRMAQRIASLETAWIPDAPVGNKDFMRDSAKEYLINGGLYDTLGWPRDPVTGKPKEWADLTPPERKQLQDKQDSAEKAIERFKEKQSMRKLQTSVDAAKALISRKDLQTEKFLGNEEIDEATLPAEVVTDKNIDKLVADYGAPTVYKMCFTQLKGNWEAYSSDYKTLLQDFHTVVGVHLDVERYFDEFGGKQLGLSVNLILLALLGIFGGGVAAYAGWKAGGWALRTGGRGIARLGQAGTRMTGNLLRRSNSGALSAESRVAAETAKTVVRGSTMEQLTRMRYIQKERQLALMLENTRAGRFISNLKFVRGARVVRGGSTVLKYGSYAVIPAVGAYEAYLTRERVTSAAGNKDLQGEYAENYKTTALETAGYGASAFLSLGPQIVLSAPVYYAADFNRSRSEVKQGWKREVADWEREFDSTGLMNQLGKTTLTNAVESGGGGALYPRIALPSKADQQKAADSIESAQTAARGRIVEAYFTKNLLLPPGSTSEDAQKIIRWKTSFVSLVTQGGFDLSSGSVYQEADLYAEMMLRKEEMEAKKEDPVVPFTDDEGRDGAIDYSKLSVGSASASDIRSQVTKYRMHVRPVEELILFNTLGQMAKDQVNPADRAKELPKSKESIRRIILGKLSHTIFKFDATIEDIDWPGVDVTFISSGDSYSKNVVRSFVAAKISKEVDALTDKTLEGDVSFKEYEKTLSKCEAIMQDFQTVKSDGRASAVYTEAAKSFDAAGLAAAGALKVNPLQALVMGFSAE